MYCSAASKQSQRHSSRPVDNKVVAVSLMSITASAESIGVRSIDGVFVFEKQEPGVEGGGG